MKRDRIEIKSYQDLLYIISDMFEEFIEPMFDDDRYTSPIEEERFIYTEEGIIRLWNKKGQKLIDSYLRRMKKVFLKNFPNEYFKVYSCYYKKF